MIWKPRLAGWASWRSALRLRQRTMRAPPGWSAGWTSRMHGQMAWMADRSTTAAVRRAVGRSAQRDRAGDELCALPPTRWRPGRPPGPARISAYAQGRDYHDTVKKALKALARWLVAEAAKRRLSEGRTASG
jgi:epoxyqueuosine reductase QueG